ncbi:hypothetical protein GCM10023322_41820 [Rugosimonospora acidiphila]|uniref:DUF3618 domain-containing protein n=1 Tax=Rugosimonospora acidiphila TaxID=556531 RepID=A0ABP9RYV0_9ACTN
MPRRSQTRRQTGNHGGMMRAELGEGIDHLRQAATHAAGGVGATVGPRLSSAMDLVGPGTERVRDVASQGWETTVAALAPLMDAARLGAIEAGSQTVRARKMMGSNKRSRSSGKRTGMLIGLLVLGAAAGAVGAMAVRRRGRDHWEEYEAGGRGMAGDQAQSVLDSTRSAMDMAAGKASSGDAASGGAERGDNRSGGSDPASSSRPDRSSRGVETATDKATAVTKNSHG